MNYQAVYDRLIARSLNRTLEGYSEKHHILPRCMGGGDEKENFATLTAREHFTAHLLLCKIFPGEPKLIFAAHAMSMQGQAGHVPAGISKNRQFEWLRKQNSKAISERRTGQKHSPETRQKLCESRAGRVTTDETRQKMSDAQKGVPKSPEKIAQMSEYMTGRPGLRLGMTNSPETRAKQSAAALARPDKEENDRKMREGFANMTPEQHSAQSTKAWETRRINGTDKFSDEQRAKMSASQKNRDETPEEASARALKAAETRRQNGNYEYSDESRERMRQAQLGKKQSPETVAKRRETRARNKALKEAQAAKEAA